MATSALPAERREPALAPRRDAVDEAHAAFLARRWFPAFDGVRALGIVPVVWHHAAGARWTGTVLARGGYGVHLFFALSGFLITTLLVRERERNGRIDLGRFWIRRALRIFPLYYATVAAYAVAVAAFEHGSAEGRQFWHNLPFFLTYTSNWFVDLEGTRVIFYFAWSLATEEQFYLVWPGLLSLATGRIAPALFMVAAVAISGAAATLATPLDLPRDSVAVRAAASISPAICLGALAAFSSHHRAGFRVLSAIAGRPGWIAVALATLVVGIALDASWWVDVAAAWLVLALALTDAPAVRALLANRVVRHVGLVSYGMYMTHMFAVNGARRLLHAHEGPLVFALALPLSVALGTATHYGFERWFLRKKDSAGRPRGREVLA